MEVFQTAVELLGKCDSNVERVGKFSEVGAALDDAADDYAGTQTQDDAYAQSQSPPMSPG